MKTKKENIVKITAMEMVDKAKRHPVFFAEYILGMKLSEYEKNRLNALIDATIGNIYHSGNRAGMNTAKNIVRKWRNFNDDQVSKKITDKTHSIMFVDECRFA